MRSPMHSEGSVWHLGGFQLLLILAAVALAVAFVGATRFALAAGFELGHGSEGKIAFSGIVLGLVTLAILFLLAKVTGAVVSGLAGTAARPATAVTVTLIICGTLCCVAVLILLLWRPAPSAGVAVQRNGGQVTFFASGSLMVLALTAAVFFAGVGMVGIGIWGSLKPNSPSRVDLYQPDPLRRRSEELAARQRELAEPTPLQESSEAVHRPEE
jgi:hypothetical protein